MRLLTFLAGFLLTLALFLPLAFAQDSQQQGSQKPQTPQAQQPTQPAQPPSGEFLRNPFAPPTGGQSSPEPQWRDRKFRIILVPGRGVNKKFRQFQNPQPLHQGPIDPGIYLPRSAGLGNVCGSIVSYNFSPGDNPKLESVTTCTPAGIVESRRAGDDEEKKPPVPRVLRTKY